LSRWQRRYSRPFGAEPVCHFAKITDGLSGRSPSLLVGSASRHFKNTNSLQSQGASLMRADCLALERQARASCRREVGHGSLRPNRSLHRCPSIGPVLLHELTFCALRGRPLVFRVTSACPSQTAFHRCARQKASASSALSSRRREYVISLTKSHSSGWGLRYSETGGLRCS
jgi:hypothetical protein